MTTHRRVLDHFHKRLLASVTRSSLLKATAGRTARLLDCSRFDAVEAGLGNRVVRRVVEGGVAVPIELRLRFRVGVAQDEGDDDREREASAAEKLVREHTAIYETLDRRMRRFAELLKRETGVQSLWLGYPLLYVAAGEGDAQQWILAPVFLWPVSIQLVHHQEGRVLIGRDPTSGGVKFNRAMAGWISRQLNFEMRGPQQDELERLTWADMKSQVELLARQFGDPPSINCDGSLEPVPNAKLLNPQRSPRLLNSGVIGIYRWQNEAILGDLENLKQLEQISGVVSGFSTGERLPQPPAVERPGEVDRYQVYDADFSQERVIWQARCEPGVVVHGPPGTGKSQTIVNVIADALGHGRTVLMVCQKYAATRVVFEKLKQVGLDQLCVEVTDTEKSRLPIFEAIRNQVDLLPASVGAVPPTRRNQLAREITRLEDELDQYGCAMHERDSAIGIAYRQMKTIEGLAYAKYPTVRHLPQIQALVEGMTWQDIEALKREIEEAGRLFGVGKPLTNPWRFSQPTLQPNAVLVADVGSSVARLRVMDANHLSQVQRHGAGVCIEGAPSAFKEIIDRLVPKVRDIGRNLRTARTQLFRAWVRELRESHGETWARFQSECESAKEVAEKVRNTPLDASWDERCQQLSDKDLARLGELSVAALRYEGSILRFLSVRFRQARQALRKYENDASDARVWELAREIVNYVGARQLRAELRLRNQKLVPRLGPAPDERAQVQFPATALEELKWAEWLCFLERQIPWLKSVVDELVANVDAESLEQVAASLDIAEQRVSNVESLLTALHSLKPYMKDEAFVEPEELIRRGWSISAWLDGLVSGLNGIQELMAWNLSRSRRAEPLDALVRILEEYEIQRLAGEHVPVPPPDLTDGEYGQWWVCLTEYSAALAWQGACHRKWPILVGITPDLHAQKVRELEKLIEEKRNCEADDICSNWLRKQITHRNAPWKRMFQLRRSRFGEAKRLREAVAASLGEGLLAMRPCWLVNPGTAAEVFPLTAGLFDLVIFDEASQCPIEQAVPAIYRGNALVVSGDEKQLPPTDFFKSSWIANQDDEERDDEATEETVSREEQVTQMSLNYLLEVEDLLSASIGNLPERLLSVHYRSKHPALIEFSNRAFYNGRLEAPPARVTSVNGYRPIRYRDVNGLYERRTNQDEAKAVVELLKEIWNAGESRPTIGVVTFNQDQRNLIEDLLDHECDKDLVFRRCYDEEKSREEDNQDVGLFIKNLENVQGDERDVMIFSTTFGRDGKKKFYRNFGPVGHGGGERRLNVAVTRSKQQVVVVSSMPIDEISSALSADLAPGSQLTPAGYLQLYLAYAKAVSDGDVEQVARVLERAGRKAAAVTTGDSDSPFEDDVREVLEKLGLTVHSQVGESGFRIDLGVLGGDPNHGYILGIECDGAAYHSDRSARLRDVWRAKILRARGWRLHRIWSTRWWYHRGEEIEALKLAVENAQSHFAPQQHTVPETRPQPQAELRQGRRESWELRLADWKRLKDELRERGDEDGLRAIGGLGTDSAHRYRVEQALKQGKQVPQDVLEDYPDLKNRGAVAASADEEG